MIPVIFINCKDEPFVDAIIDGRKVYETRNRNSLRSLLFWALGQRILIAETGHGDPVVKCSAVIDKYGAVHDQHTWDYMREHRHAVPFGSKYDWKPNTKVKWLYHLKDVQPVVPFRLPSSCRRHGRVWAEYEGSVEE